MAEPILDTEYWRNRLEHSLKGELHHAVFRCPLDRWKRIEEKHRQILAKHISPWDSILDAGCGWGRLLNLLQIHTEFDDPMVVYRGVDISPDFIELAKKHHPNRVFYVKDLRNLPLEWRQVFDWAVLISIRPMVIRNLGQGEWDNMEKELRRVARKLLYLEYDENDEGSIE